MARYFALFVLSVAWRGVAASMPRMTAATVSCMSSSCKTCVSLPIRDSTSTVVELRPCITIDFENHDMAVHFTGTLDGQRVLESEISGVTPPNVCFLPDKAADLQVCLSFHDVNSVGNSLQVCVFLEGSIINNPPNVVANLGCFVADTQASSVRHASKPRKNAAQGA